MKYRTLAVAAVAALAAACGDAAGPVSTADPAPTRPRSAAVIPELVTGNISGTGSQVCTSLPVNGTGATWFGFKVEGPVSHTVAGIQGTVTNNNTLAWSAAPGYLVQAVIVKGGTGQYIYRYAGSMSGDSGLVSPPHATNTNNTLPDISHWTVCYTVRLGVTKTAATTFDREYTWGINKTASDTLLTLTQTQVFTVSYNVTLSATSQDINHAVSGTITVHNPAPVNAVVSGVSDVLSSGETVSLTCPAFPQTLAPGGTLQCTYQAGLPNGNARTNTGSATSSTAGVENGSGQAAVSFGNPTNLIDACVAASDTYSGSNVPAQVCVTALVNGSKTYTYTRDIGPLPGGVHTITNTASFVTPRAISGSSTRNVVVTVPVANGCTLTQGYWKTHGNGSRHFDPKWLNIGDAGSNMAFFVSGQTWMEVFRTPVQGNAYYQLAHQYMAARLNQAGGAAVPADVGTAISNSTAFFTSANPAARLSSTLRTTLQGYATLLASYNEGRVGPGHCSE